ncbi:hypothetical protein MMC31_003606 [Peltigera leucophlebia]|nr:hypothetical protein [Peltigera leucophlebia]
MAATIPTALKHADIARFAQRAGQLEKAKPVVAYWCNYWIVNQILAKGLHNSDDESMTYTMHLMDKLEQSKADHRDNEAIVDDLAGQAYVDQFGTETLERAESAMKLNKATRQTADTFLASATFLELCQIWGPLDPAVASKIKYAKYHAVRIAKAIKAGEDPNLYNPAPMETSATVQPSVQFESPQFQPADDVKQEERDRVRSTTYQPFVEDVPDGRELSELQIAQPLRPSGAPSTSETTSQDPAREYYHSATERVENYHSQLGNDGLAAMEPAQGSSATFDEVGYFPRISGSNGIEQPVPASQEIPWDERALAPPPNPSDSSMATPSLIPTT